MAKWKNERRNVLTGWISFNRHLNSYRMEERCKELSTFALIFVNSNS